jgi:hypothetical protein
MKTMKLADKNGKPVEIGDEVQMPFPSEYGTDLWSHEFVGTIIDIDEELENITVIDQEDDCWDIDPIRVEIV